MGIRFSCPSGHKLNVKEFLAGKRGVCPQCGAKFVIPMPNETPATGESLPLGVGLSRSIEIAVAPGPGAQLAAAPASPSVIIPATDVELATPVLEQTTTFGGQQVSAADALPASIVAVQSPIDVAKNASVPLHRSPNRRNQILISLLLLALVVLLAGVLVWVLQREVNQTPSEKTAAVARKTLVPGVAIVSSRLFPSVYRRDEALER